MMKQIKEILINQLGFSRMGMIIAVVVVVAALSLFLGLLKGKNEGIQIGAVISLSGPAGPAIEGIDVRNGMALAVEEINTWGGINGRKVKLIVEDAASDPQKAREAFNRIETRHHPILYVSTYSAMSMALAPQAGENKVVLFGLVVTAPDFTKQNEWVFRYWPTAREEIRGIVSMVRNLRISHMGVIYLDDEYGRSVYESLDKELKRTGVSLKGEPYELRETEFRGQIERLKDSGGILVIGFPVHIASIVTQLRAMQFKGVILSNNGAAGPQVKGLPDAEGVYLTAPIIYNPNFVFSNEIKKKCETRHGKPFSHYTANGYDLIKIVASLLRDEAISRSNLRRLLEKGFVYPGAFGNLDVRPGKRDISFPLYPARVVKGEIRYLGYEWTQKHE